MRSHKTAVIGLQTGDEGKGVRDVRIVENAVERSGFEPGDKPRVWNMRFQGGANAGHTAVKNGETYKLHQIPSGVLIPGSFNLMGEGVFFNPRSAVEELRGLQERGIEISPKNFGIASNAHVTLAYHTEEDRVDLEKQKHTSTGSGIKQTAVDKVGRVGLRFEEFLDRDTFRDVLKEKRFPDFFPARLGSIEEFVDSYQDYVDFLKDFSVLQSKIVHGQEFQYGIGEGAQGFRLDVDRGLYPGVTSSNPSMIPFRADVILGVMKLYESSVGHDRPFIGQMPEKLEGIVREKWGETGTTTGLPRDLGYVDIVAINNAIESSEVDYLIGTCGDRLEVMHELGEPVKLVVAYEIDGTIYEEWDTSFHNRNTLYHANPIFERFSPWKRFVDDNNELTGNAQKYVDRIQELTGREFILMGTGQGIQDVIEYKNPLDLTRFAGQLETI